jgi:hypothetical protein
MITSLATFYVTKGGEKRKKVKPCSDSVEIKKFRSKNCENSPQKKKKEKQWAHSLCVVNDY